MPRANRYYLPGHVWHITHRCHKREFLLKFQRDREAWRYWLYQARRRYGLCIFNFIVTSNHIHLLVQDRGRDEIPASMRLIAGRTAQAYNLRKGRKGAFWEDRYHATAVETGEHLSRCLAYIDLNMVRAGIVEHPSQWPVSGFQEIQTPRRRYRIVDREALTSALSLGGVEVLSGYHAARVNEAMSHKQSERDPRWSEALAVGSDSFVQRVHVQFGLRALDRSVHLNLEDGIAHIAESAAPYADDFEGKMPGLKR